MKTGITTEIKEELETVRTDNGGTITPAAVRGKALDESTAIHKWFTDHGAFNEQYAIEQFQLQLARRLIVSVTVVISEPLSLKQPWNVNVPAWPMVNVSDSAHCLNSPASSSVTAPMTHSENSYRAVAVPVPVTVAPEIKLLVMFCPPRARFQSLPTRLVLVVAAPKVIVEPLAMP